MNPDIAMASESITGHIYMPHSGTPDHRHQCDFRLQHSPRASECPSVIAQSTDISTHLAAVEPRHGPLRAYGWDITMAQATHISLVLTTVMSPQHIHHSVYLIFSVSLTRQSSICYLLYSPRLLYDPRLQSQV